MNDHLDRRTVTFIVRLCTEYLKQPSPTWRGEIEYAGSSDWQNKSMHIRSGQRWTFNSPSELLNFLSQLVES